MSRNALIITTYNNPRFLGLCLSSLTNQSCQDFDLYIADDGSDQKTHQKIDSFRSKIKGKVVHVWHEDRGYRKSTINNGVFRLLENYQTVILVDGDVILHRRFIEDHLEVHAKSSNELVFMGRRVELGKKITSWLSEEKICQFNRGISWPLLQSIWKGDTKNGLRAIRLKSLLLRKMLRRDRVDDLLGSNFSLNRSLLYRVNGYNEKYQSYWGEDGDLFIRLRNSGAKILGSKSIAIQYHLDHPRLEPDLESQKRYLALLKNRQYRHCDLGIRNNIELQSKPSMDSFQILSGQ